MQKTYGRALRILAAAGAIAILAISAAAQQGTPSTPAASAPKTAAPSAASAPKKPVAKPEGALVLKTDKDKTSYAVGRNVGASMKSDGVDVDPDVFVQGVKDALAGRPSLLSDADDQAVMTALKAEVGQKMAEKTQQLAEQNQKNGEAFLAANKSKDGVVTTASGLQYKILTAGTGPKPTASDTVTCNYRGTLVDGTEFDSSYKRGQPASFPVGGVIKGWTEALQMMPVGSKWQLVLPSDLAYGPQGAGPIGPNSVLIFEVELLSIKGK